MYFMKAIDMTGWVMSEHGVPDSRLTVIKLVEPHITKSGKKQRQYLCECSCIDPITLQHPQVIVKGNFLRNGNTKSCGCLAHEKIIERNIKEGHQIQIGDRFGKLTVIKDLGFRKQQSRNKQWRWSLCECDCGNICEAANNILLNGHKKSCGCINSVGEEIIANILKENNIQYIQEYKFEDLKSKNNAFYRFDFAVFKNNYLDFLIEFDGRQHYSGPENGWQNTRSLEEIQQADKEKNEYCLKHNIILKRIPFFQISEINLESILSDQFNINKG